MVKPINKSALVDRNFDDLSERFAERIYDSEKGRLRLDLIQADLHACLDLSKPLKVLDAGGGQGQMSAWLHDLGHDVTLVDLSQSMMNSRDLQERPSIACHQSSVQDFLNSCDQTFDLILCHAVLEWLVEPLDLLARLGQQLKPNGCLSIIFFNKNSLVMTHAMKGNWDRLTQDRPRPFKTKGLTPQYPLLPEEVEAAWATTGCDLRVKRGIRVFHDYVIENERHRLEPDLSFQVEQQWGVREPWWRLGRYIHFLGFRE